MPPAPDRFVGRSIGAIRIAARLGAGAMGVVYRARHDRLAKDVAVKVMAIDANRGSGLQRFLREGRAAASVQHPNVVQVFEAGEFEGNAFLVMELVNGYSLGNVLDEIKAKDGVGALPPETMAGLGQGIARGIAAIHAQGIVHRDIKPDNILIGADRQPKVADLGLAKQLNDPDVMRLTGTGMVVGTPLYVSPEAIRDPQTVTAKADIYSLGCTFYHMLAGRPPFLSDSAYEVMRSHLEDRPKSLRELRPGLPAPLVEMVESCLDKKPEHRPDAAAIAAMLAGETQAATGRKRGAGPFLAISGLAAAAILAGLFLWLRPGAPTAGAVGAGAAAAPGGTLVVKADAPRLRLRLGDGDWLPMPAGGMPMPAGRHEVTVEADQPGPARLWRGSCEVAVGATVSIVADLATRPVPELRLELPGPGMLYRDGEPLGLAPAATVDLVGTYHLARWDGTRFRTRTVVVDLSGKPRPGIDGALERPDGPAWWHAVDADGAACPEHHLVCWWEADRARTQQGLAEPAGWRELAARPEQPVVRLPVGIALSVVDLLGAGATMPDRAAAIDLSRRLRLALWYRDDRGKPAVVGGGSGQTAAALAVVPAAR